MGCASEQGEVGMVWCCEGRYIFLGRGDQVEHAGGESDHDARPHQRAKRQEMRCVLHGGREKAPHVVVRVQRGLRK
jgi:hypothetical protein